MSELGAAALRARLRNSLGAGWAPLRAVLREAELARAEAFLVGGPVRDLLLGRPVHDVDVLLSDRLEQVARAGAARLEARVRLHPRFLTATIEGTGFRIDLSRARSERYARPGALPEVRPATPLVDLPRRDFSIHALALPLSARAGPRLLDPTGGLADLQGGRLRVLHDASFRDDPTRLLRAARYAARLGFRLEPHSLRLAREATSEGLLASLSGDRVLHEIERLLAEADSARAARETEWLGLFAALVPRWRLQAEARRGLGRLDRARLRAPWPGVDPALLVQTGLRVLLWQLPRGVREPAIARLGLRGRPGRGIGADLTSVAGLRRALAGTPGDGRLDELLRDLSEPGLLLAHCVLASGAARRVSRFAARLRQVPAPLEGHAAQALGARGPEIGALLRAARRRALDGAEVDAAWAKRWLARHRRMG